MNYYNSFTWKCINLKRLVVDVKVHQGQVVFQKAPSNSSLLPIFSYILTLMLVVLLSQTMDSRWLLYAQKAAKIFYWRSFELLCSMLRFVFDSSFLKSGLQCSQYTQLSILNMKNRKQITATTTERPLLLFLMFSCWRSFECSILRFAFDSSFLKSKLQCERYQHPAGHVFWT